MYPFKFPKEVFHPALESHFKLLVVVGPRVYSRFKRLEFQSFLFLGTCNKSLHASQSHFTKDDHCQDDDILKLKTTTKNATTKCLQGNSSSALTNEKRGVTAFDTVPAVSFVAPGYRPDALAEHGYTSASCGKKLNTHSHPMKGLNRQDSS